MTGPIAAATPAQAFIKPTYLPRSRNETRSQHTISNRTYIAPAPTPCTVRPAIIMSTLFEPPATPLPKANSAVATIRGVRRPKMSASWPTNGCMTQDATTKEFAIQTYSCSTLPMSAVIRGSAVVTIATSSAEMNARRQRAKKMPQKRRLNGVFDGR